MDNGTSTNARNPERAAYIRDWAKRNPSGTPDELRVQVAEKFGSSPANNVLTRMLNRARSGDRAAKLSTEIAAPRAIAFSADWDVVGVTLNANGTISVTYTPPVKSEEAADAE